MTLRSTSHSGCHSAQAQIRGSNPLSPAILRAPNLNRAKTSGRAQPAATRAATALGQAISGDQRISDFVPNAVSAEIRYGITSGNVRRLEQPHQPAPVRRTRFVDGEGTERPHLGRSPRGKAIAFTEAARSQTSRVVTAAALIMVSVAGFVLTNDPIVKSIGFALAVGVGIDAFLIRMTLIPALMSVLGSRPWWLPNWLARVIPRVDIEGVALELDPQQQEPHPSSTPVRAA
jgi:hypothetical protein